MSREIISIIRARLRAMSEEGYAEFSARLIPTVPRERILGVRLPALRLFAGELIKQPEAQAFLSALPHTYLEENTLHALLLNAEKSLEGSEALLRSFLPHVDNWATCDALRPAAIKKHFKMARGFIYECIESRHAYTVRFGIEMLMCYGLKDDFSIDFHERVAAVRSDDYYVNMMRAWYFATALCERYEQTLPWLEGRRLDDWTHGRSIQKAVESLRISEEQKAFLRTLRRAKQGGGGKTGVSSKGVSKKGAQKPERAAEAEPKSAGEESEKPLIEVAAAVIRRGERVLICRRPKHKARGGQWEFPGGKLEAGETAEQALLRECREELDISLNITRPLAEFTHIYPDIAVRLFVFECTVESGEPKSLEHSELAFVEPNALFSYDICEADREIASIICGRQSG